MSNPLEIIIFLGNAALLDAAKKGDLARIQKLLTPENINCRDTQGRNSTALHLAAGYNNFDVVEHLLEKNADVNARDRGGLIGELENSLKILKNLIFQIFFSTSQCQQLRAPRDRRSFDKIQHTNQRR